MKARVMEHNALLPSFTSRLGLDQFLVNLEFLFVAGVQTLSHLLSMRAASDGCVNNPWTESESSKLPLFRPYLASACLASVRRQYALIPVSPSLAAHTSRTIKKVKSGSLLALASWQPLDKWGRLLASPFITPTNEEKT